MGAFNVLGLGSNVVTTTADGQVISGNKEITGNWVFGSTPAGSIGAWQLIVNKQNNTGTAAWLAHSQYYGPIISTEATNTPYYVLSINTGATANTPGTGTAKFRVLANGRTLINTTTDNGQDFQVNGTGYFATSLKLGASGTALTQTRVYSQSLDVASVPANSTAEQTFTVTGLATTDKVFVNKPSHSSGLALVNARVSAADTLALTFANITGSAIDPAAETYQIVAIRS